MRVYLLMIVLLFNACSHSPTQKPGTEFKHPQETHFKSLRQLTFGGINRNAHWSFNGNWLTFQHQGPGLLPRLSKESLACDQTYKIRFDGTEAQRISSGKGKTASPYFFPNHLRILYSSTEKSSSECPKPPKTKQKQVTYLDPTFQIYASKEDGTDPIPLDPAASRAYHSETNVCEDERVVFTSSRAGNLDLYRGALQHFGVFKEVRKITDGDGYAGDASFSSDCKKIVWSWFKPTSKKELENFYDLLSDHFVRLKTREIWMADADGSHPRQVTKLGALSVTPTFTPDGQKILFASNLRSSGGSSGGNSGENPEENPGRDLKKGTQRDPKKNDFDLYLVDTQGNQLELISWSHGMDRDPAFSPDGKYLVFSSQRNAQRNVMNPDEENLFIAEWDPKPSYSNE